jgi:hypothetical protein
MTHITLYIPNSPTPEEYDVKTYGLNEGRLHFQIEGSPVTNVTTTVPFTIRQTVEEKGKSPAASRPSHGGGSQWS